MSVSNLLVPNNLNLFCDFINTVSPSTDYQIYMDPYSHFISFGPYGYNLPIPTLLTFQVNASAETITWFGNVSQQSRTLADKGFQLTGIKVIYQVQTQALSSVNFQFDILTFLDGLPLSNVAMPASGLMPLTVSGANLHVAQINITNPRYLTEGEALNLALTFTTQAATVLDFYGVILVFNQNNL